MFAQAKMSGVFFSDTVIQCTVDTIQYNTIIQIQIAVKPFTFTKLVILQLNKII